MESQPKPSEPRDMGKLVMAILVAAIVISVGAIGFVVYSNSQASKGLSLTTIKVGDKVMMNYIGRFSDGRVFDTTLASVGRDNALYPKSLTYTARSNSSYVPFNMTAGNYGSGGTIKGFALGVIDLHEGDHVIIDVPAAGAYPVNQSMVHTAHVVDNVSVLQPMSEFEFESSFGTTPVVGQVYKHYFWGWDAVVVSDQAGEVVVRNDPYVGQVVFPFGNPSNASDPSGWPVVVLAYDANANGGQGSIEIRHELPANPVYNVKGKDIDGLTFVIAGFNATAGTFTISKSNSSTGYNGEIAGRELFFEVTILKVTSA